MPVPHAAGRMKAKGRIVHVQKAQNTASETGYTGPPVRRSQTPMMMGGFANVRQLLDDAPKVITVIGTPSVSPPMVVAPNQ